MKEPSIIRILPAAALFIVAMCLFAYMGAFDQFMDSRPLSALLSDTGDLLLASQGGVALIALWVGIRHYLQADPA